MNGPEITTEDADGGSHEATDILLSKERLNELYSPNGGYVKALTDELGVPWPLEKGWKKELVSRNIRVSPSKWSRLLHLRNVSCKQTKAEERTNGTIELDLGM